MSLQWALVASFLYFEIGFLILLLLPVIPPRAWQRFFKSRFLQSLESQANLYFTGFLIILVLLFLDSIREMRKYSAGRETEIEHGHLDSELQYSMKLFRAQRNFYVAGFALFLCLVIRRIVLLIQKQATLIAENQAALQQAKSASEAASKAMSSSSSSGPASSSGDTSSSASNKSEMEKLKNKLEEALKECSKLKTSEETLKRQAKGLTDEYDRLMKEHEAIQKKYEKLVNAADTRKDR